MLEVCLDSFESAKAAVEGGANRIELCSALSEGGLTPTAGLLKTVKSHVNFLERALKRTLFRKKYQFPNVPVFAMLRPHGRISYRYSNADMAMIQMDIGLLIDSGADGFVFGGLTSDRDIDVDRCQKVVQLACGLPVTYHRAFDMSIPANKFQSIDKIAKCGFSRILSSGLAETAEKGIDILTEMNKYIGERNYDVILLPGCGITPKNAEFILQTSRCKEFHSSAKSRIVENIPSHESDTDFIDKDITNNSYKATNRETVQQLVQIGKSHQ